MIPVRCCERGGVWRVELQGSNLLVIFRKGGYI